MKYTITTFRRTAGLRTFTLVKETKCGDLTEALGVWMRAQRDFTVDRIMINVEKN